MKQDWSKHFLLRSEQKTFFFSLKQRGSPANKRTLEKTAISLEGAHLHTITCGTATYTKMIWIPLFLHLLASSAVNTCSTHHNDPAFLTGEYEEVSLQGQKEHYHRDAGKDKCTMPCELTAKLMREEKHSLCSNLQHTIVSYTRNTRKLIRDLIDEQQKALEFLSSQIIELMAKVNALSSDVQRSNSDIFSVKPMESHGDAFRGYDQEQNQDTVPFSTSDVDNDGCSPFCSFADKVVESCSVNQNNTGWWFNQCGKANLNGSPLDQDLSTQSHIHWDTWTKNGTLVKIKSVTMKIRRVEISNSK
uniref:Angiopoietin-like 5 n=1 Tax=Cyprinus carpio TaxID=7962 RepID=A0A8C1ISY3_CYPCA